MQEYAAPAKAQRRPQSMSTSLQLCPGLQLHRSVRPASVTRTASNMESRLQTPVRQLIGRQSEHREASPLRRRLGGGEGSRSRQSHSPCRWPLSPRRHARQPKPGRPGAGRAPWVEPTPLLDTVRRGGGGGRGSRRSSPSRRAGSMRRRTVSPSRTTRPPPGELLLMIRLLTFWQMQLHADLCGCGTRLMRHAVCKQALRVCSTCKFQGYIACSLGSSELGSSDNFLQQLHLT